MKFLAVIFFFTFLVISVVSAQQPQNYAKNYKELKNKYDCLLGMKVKKVIQKMALDTSNISLIEEPPFVLNGFSFNGGDTVVVECYFERTGLFGKPGFPVNRYYEYISKKKIRSISIFERSTKQYYNLKR